MGYDAIAARRTRLMAATLDVPEDRLHVIAPDVGGGFGPKVVFYPEEVLVPFAARP